MSHRDWLGLAALVAALVATASAEYSLARACGYGALVAGCVPASLDVYALRAFSVRRDVPAVVIALIVANALAHLVAFGALPVCIPLVITVSAIAPLVLWRVKVLSAAQTPIAAPVSAQRDAPEATPAPAPERPSQGKSAVPAPASADPLLATARAFADQVQRDSGKAPSLRALQAHLRIGQARAQRIRAALPA